MGIHTFGAAPFVGLEGGEFWGLLGARGGGEVHGLWIPHTPTRWPSLMEVFRWGGGVAGGVYRDILTHSPERHTPTHPRPRDHTPQTKPPPPHTPTPHSPKRHPLTHHYTGGGGGSTLKPELAPLSALRQCACRNHTDTQTQAYTHTHTYNLFLHVHHPKKTCKLSGKGKGHALPNLNR